MTAVPAMLLWTDAYMADTSHLTTVEHGAYLLLLMAMWRAGGSLPNDDVRLARIAKLSLDKWHKVAPTVMEFMTVDGKAVTQKRLKLEFEIASGKAEKLALAGRAGGRAKALKNIQRKPSDASETPEAEACHEPSESLPNQLPVTNDQITASKEAVAAAAQEKISKEEIERRCEQAAGFGELSGIGKIVELVEAGADLDDRVLPIIREMSRKKREQGAKVANWLYFAAAIADPDRKLPAPPIAVDLGLFVPHGSPAWLAWDGYGRRTKGSGYPSSIIVGGEPGWRFPSEYPPSSDEAAA